MEDFLGVDTESSFTGQVFAGLVNTSDFRGLIGHLIDPAPITTITLLKGDFPFLLPVAD